MVLCLSDISTVLRYNLLLYLYSGTSCYTSHLIMLFNQTLMKAVPDVYRKLMSYVMNGFQNPSFLQLQKRCRANLQCWKGEYSCNLYVEDVMILVRIMPWLICFVIFFFFFFFPLLSLRGKAFSSSYQFHTYFFSSKESFFPSLHIFAYSFLIILFLEFRFCVFYDIDK